MTALFVIDPLAQLNQTYDTSLGLMHAFDRMGERVLVAEAGQLTIREGRAWARAAAWTSAAPCDHGSHRPVCLDDVDVVLARVEPPLDADYLAMTRVLDHVDPVRTALVNSPQALREVCEHTWGLRFPGLAPTTLVSADRRELAAFVATHRRAVLKPMDGFGGAGVFLAVEGDANLAALLDAATAGYRRLVIAQQWLAGVAEGNRRLFLFDGEPLGPVVVRVPASPDFRIGPPVGLDGWNQFDAAIATRIGADLLAVGARFVGVDVIDGAVVDVNVTSPGALRKADILAGSTELCDEMVRRLIRARTQPLLTMEALQCVPR